MLRWVVRAVCSLPFEYCEWGTQFEKCKEKFAADWKQIYPNVDESDLTELMQRLGFEGLACA